MTHVELAVSPGGRPMDTSPFSASTTDNWVARAGGLPTYVRGVAHALLRTGRAHDLSEAVKLALGAIQNWASGRTTNGKGHVHPAVQAAAVAALADWEAKRAKAHAHANDTKAVELAGIFNAAAHPRAAAGATGGGQFVSGSSGSTTKTSTSTIHSKQTGRYYTQSQWSALHQEHMDHLQHLVDTGKATPAQKAELAGLKKQKAVAAKTAASKAKAKAKAPAATKLAGDGPTVELAGMFNEALHPRVPAGGAGGGEFGSAAAKQPAPTNQQPVGRGQTGQQVSDLQARLNALGAKPPLAVDGTFGPKTLAAVEAFQRANGLKVDGLVGPKTTAALRAVATKKVAAVKAKATVAKKTATTAKAVAKTKAPAAPKVNKTKGTVTATVNGKKVTMTLHQWHALHVAHEQAAATKLAGDNPAVELAVKTPAPERAADRQALAAKGQALADGSFPIPTVEYLKKAIRSVGRAPASKRPALKALIRKRARQLGAMNEPGVKDTWAFQAANDTEGIELAMMTKTARVRGPGDVTCSRTASGEVTVTHKPTGMRIGKLTPAQHGGWQGTHATGKATPPSGSMTGALSGLIGVHNKIAASMPDAMPMPEVQAHAQQLAAMELAGSFTPAVTSGDGPRVTTMGAAAKTAKTVSAPASGAPSAVTIASWPAEVQAVYRKLLAKGFSPKQAMAFAKRAAAMHAKAAAKAA